MRIAPLADVKARLSAYLDEGSGSKTGAASEGRSSRAEGKVTPTRFASCTSAAMNIPEIVASAGTPRSTASTSRGAVQGGSTNRVSDALSMLCPGCTAWSLRRRRLAPRRVQDSNSFFLAAACRKQNDTVVARPS